MSNFPIQGPFIQNIYNQSNIQNNNYVTHSQSHNPNSLSRQDTPTQNESKPSAIVATCFEFIRPYFRISQLDVFLSIKDIFFPIKSRTRLLDLYIPSVSVSTFILLSTIYRVLYDNSYTKNPAEMLARVASWITFLISMEVLLLKFIFFIFKVQTNTMIIPHDNEMASKEPNSDPYNQNIPPNTYVQTPIVQSDGVPLLALLSVSGYKFTPMSAILSLSLLYRGSSSFWINPFKFYSYITASINAFRCFEGLHLTTFNNTSFDMRKPNLSHAYLLIYIASAIQFLISWALMPKQLN